MTLAWKYGRPIKEKLLTLEEPGKPLLFDADRRLVDEVLAQCDVNALVGSLKGKGEKEAEQALKDFGKKVMELTIELADSKYMDRSGEMIEKVAKQTGISFPHRFERYIELGTLASRPTDRWNIAKATTKELVFQVSSCSVAKAMADAGVSLPCSAMCRGLFEAAMEKTGDKLSVEMTKALGKDGTCEFTFTLQP